MIPHAMELVHIGVQILTIFLRDTSVKGLAGPDHVQGSVASAYHKLKANRIKIY